MPTILIAFLFTVPLSFSANNKEKADFDDVKEIGGVVQIGRNVRVAKDTIADGPIVVIAGDAMILGDVDDDVIVIGGRLHLDAKVEGNVVAIGPEAKLGPKAVVIQNLVTIGTEVFSDDDSVIRGKLVSLHGFGMGVVASLVGLLSMLAGMLLWFKIFSAVGWILLSLLGGMFIPRSLEATSKSIASQPGYSILAAILLPPGLLLLSFALLVSIIGIPLVPLLWVLAAGTLIWGTTAFGLWLGHGLLKAYGRDSKETWQPALVGMVVLQVILLIPFVGKGVFLIAAGLGAGASIVSVLRSLRTRF